MGAAGAKRAEVSPGREGGHHASFRITEKESALPCIKVPLITRRYLVPRATRGAPTMASASAPREAPPPSPSSSSSSSCWWDAPIPDASAFGQLCADEQSGGGAVSAGRSNTTGGGRGLFAARSFARGDVVFGEAPALLVQDADNRSVVRACASCHAFLRRKGRPMMTTDEVEGSEGSEGGIGRGGAACGTRGGGEAGDDECECAQGCGEAYCDSKCRDRHAADGHRILCVGPLDTWDHPLAKLKLAAARDEHGDGILALLTEATGRCFAAAAADDDAQTLPPECPGGGAHRGCPSHAALVRSHLHWFVRGAWWDHAGGSRGTRVESLRRRCAAYAGALSGAMRAAAEARTCDPTVVTPLFGTDDGGLVSERGVAELAGLLVRNQLSVVVESPTVQRARRLLDRERRARAGAGRAESGHDEEEARALEAELVAAGALQRRTDPSEAPGALAPSVLLSAAQDACPAYDGAGLFPLVCLMNHSCDPNVEVWFVGGYREPARCRVVAVRDIAIGDELRHAYIDTSRPMQLRAADLAGFGFTCDCARCARARGGGSRMACA